MEKIPMTADGLARLEEELKTLKSIERPAVIRAIAEAREHGDLSENAEYHAARERQSFIEGRILELEDVVSRAQVIDISKLTGNEEVVYQIVGAHEADIKLGRLSVHAPLARALIGKTLGESVEVNSPGGSKSYEIVDVKFV